MQTIATPLKITCIKTYVVNPKDVSVQRVSTPPLSRQVAHVPSALAHYLFIVIYYNKCDCLQ